MLVWEGDDAKTSGIFYVVLVQYVFLFGLETWVVTCCILKAVENLQNLAVCWISGRMTRRQRNVIWVYPLIGEYLVSMGQGPVGNFINRQHNTVAKYTTTQSIYDITVSEERIPFSPELLHWYEQAVIRFGDLEGGV